jgi:hypothetical protein
MKHNKYTTPSRTSPRRISRACLCPNNTYHVDCCDGSLRAQGVGQLARESYVEVKKYGREFSEDFSNDFK